MLNGKHPEGSVGKARGWCGALVCAVLVSIAVPRSATAGLLEQLSAPGGFDKFSLQEALLIASGVETNELLARYSSKLSQVVDTIAAASVAANAPDGDLATTVHQQMHRLSLVRYDAGLGDLRVTLDTGVYNCLTGTVLYVLAARRAGLLSSPYAVEGRVLPLVFDTQGPRFLEATDPKSTASRTWWRPLVDYQENRRSLQETLGPMIEKARTAVRAMQKLGRSEEAAELARKLDDLVGNAESKAPEAAVPDMKSGHDIDPPAIAALFLWNRSISAAERGDAVAAIGLLKDLFRLGGYAQPEPLRRIRLLELRSMLVEQGERAGWPKALATVEVLLDVSDYEGDKSMVRGLRADVFVRWAGAAQGNPARACEILKRGARANPENALLAQAKGFLPRNCESGTWRWR